MFLDQITAGEPWAAGDWARWLCGRWGEGDNHTSQRTYQRAALELPSDWIAKKLREYEHPDIDYPPRLFSQAVAAELRASRQTA
jgi:hypothetical protein